ncbi:hypothetical protein L596_006369 [Steinernema carpocapsae]|uniref:VWFD domain-containing protein n=1 Tax=Steinernema carpocapsae TaxID=34508 RepID=A0A4U8V1V2_STECR|nr:hypothetical protein L596_006369 [Steinernema carpocapsae]
MDSPTQKLSIIVPKMKIEAELDGDDMKVDHRLHEDNKEKYQKRGLVVRENVLELDNNDIKVVFDGETIIIRVASIYKNRMCGLCNAQKKEDKCPSSTRTTTKSAPWNPAKPHLDDDDLFFDATQQDEEEIELIKYTAVKEMDDMLCFTKMPATRCPEGTKVAKKQNIKTHIVCADVNNHRAQELEMEASDKRTIVDLSYIQRYAKKTMERRCHCQVLHLHLILSSPICILNLCCNICD